jgi:hypothetical protein
MRKYETHQSSDSDRSTRFPRRSFASSSSTRPILDELTLRRPECLMYVFAILIILSIEPSRRLLTDRRYQRDTAPQLTSPNARDFALVLPESLLMVFTAATKPIPERLVLLGLVAFSSASDSMVMSPSIHKEKMRSSYIQVKRCLAQQTDRRTAVADRQRPMMGDKLPRAGIGMHPSITTR